MYNYVQLHTNENNEKIAIGCFSCNEQQTHKSLIEFDYTQLSESILGKIWNGTEFIAPEPEAELGPEQQSI